MNPLGKSIMVPLKITFSTADMGIITARLKIEKNINIYCPFYQKSCFLIFSFFFLFLSKQCFSFNSSIFEMEESEKIVLKIF